MENDQHKNVARVFDHFASDYVDKFMDVSLYSNGLDRCISTLPINARILDIGCGPGNISKYISDKFPSSSITGIDISAEMIKIAQRMIPSGNFIHGNVTQLADLEGDFDLIICGFILPYLEPQEVEQLIRQTSVKLKQGGILCVITMISDENNILERTSEQLESCTIHMHYYTKEFVISSCSNTGVHPIFQEEMVNPYNEEKELLVLFKKD